MLAFKSLCRLVPACFSHFLSHCFSSQALYSCSVRPLVPQMSSLLWLVLPCHLESSVSTPCTPGLVTIRSPFMAQFKHHHIFKASPGQPSSEFPQDFVLSSLRPSVIIYLQLGHLIYLLIHCLDWRLPEGIGLHSARHRAFHITHAQYMFAEWCHENVFV